MNRTKNFPIGQIIIILVAQILLIYILIWQWQKLPNGNFHLLMFNIPIGDGFLIETPQGHTIAIDGGIDNTIVSKIYSQQSFFNKQIDALILTHPDSDHVNGAYEILKNFEVGSLFITGVKSENMMYKELISLAEEKSIPIIYANYKQGFMAGNNAFYILYPDKNLVDQEVKDINETSIVIRVKTFGKTIMLTGDAGVDTEKEMLLSDNALVSDILKIGHHGSKSSTSDGFLSAVNPKLALISAGEKNTFGHPHQEIINKLIENSAEVLTTKNVGDIEVIISPDSYQIKTL